jgi:hypothetical protein
MGEEEAYTREQLLRLREKDQGPKKNEPPKKDPLKGKKHGTRHVYQRYNCRCSACRKAAEAYALSPQRKKTLDNYNEKRRKANGWNKKK